MSVTERRVRYTIVPMPDTREQSFANHARLDPRFHFFVVPVFAINVVYAVFHAFRHPNYPNFWGIVVALAALMAVFLIRVYALKVQDRVIRLEERLRLGALAGGLREGQLIALRFASDEEAPALAKKAQIEKLGPKQIKQAIRIWRPDYWRV
jgi:hypothetical protein